MFSIHLPHHKWLSSERLLAVSVFAICLEVLVWQALPARAQDQTQSGPSAGDNLQSIPAADIERIEVITTPPAQYKADGAAGVINIITRKKHQDGYSGSVLGSLGTAGRSVVGANASYSSGQLTASINGTYRQDYRRRLVQSDLVAQDPTTDQLVDNRSSLPREASGGVGGR